jgi:hypothetical protein
LTVLRLASSRLKPGLRAASELARPDVLGFNRAETTVFMGLQFSNGAWMGSWR